VLKDTVAERVVLSGLINGNLELFVDVNEILYTAEVFTDNINSAIFSCIKHLYTVKEFDKIDMASLYGCMNELGYSWIMTKKEDSLYLNGVISSYVEPENTIKWAAKIRKLQIAREIRKIQNKNIEKIEEITGNESIEEILGLAEDSVLDLIKKLNIGEVGETKLLADGVDEWLESLDENKDVGISTGYKYYDYYLGGGLRRKTVSMVGARIKVGKSMFAANVCLNVSSRNIPILYIDTEMDYEEHWPRVLSNICFNDGFNVGSRDIETGKFKNSEKIKQVVFGARDKLKKLPFHYRNVAGMNPKQIFNVMRRWVHKHVKFGDDGRTNDCVIIYDYLKVHDESIKHNVAEYQVLGTLMTNLYCFAKEYDVPILAFTQLNRDGIDKETTSAIAGSDRLLWTSANFAIFKCKSEEEIKTDNINNGTRKLVMMHCRHGEEMGRGDYINYRFDGKFADIKELETKGNILKRLARRVKQEDESRFNDS
jgi:replicative DNA helicase